MLRSITHKPPVPPAKDNAAELAGMRADAAKLRDQIRLANKMGEREVATQLRQQLTKVDTDIKVAEITAPPHRTSPPRVPSRLFHLAPSLSGRRIWQISLGR